MTNLMTHIDVLQLSYNFHDYAFIFIIGLLHFDNNVPFWFGTLELHISAIFNAIITYL